MHIAERPVPDTAAASTDETGLGAVFAARRRKRRITAGLAVLLVVAAGAYIYGRFNTAPTVSVIELRTQTAERVLAVTGRVRPKQSVLVVPKAAGQVIELLKDEGDTVTAGEYLGRIDDARAISSRTQARAAADSQRRALAQAERDLDRAQTLKNQGTVTAAALETATLAVTRGREELRRLEAAVQDAALRTEEFKLIAPMTGRILSRPVDPGQVVSVTSAIFEIAPTVNREVETEVDEATSMSLAVGQTARIAFAGIPTQATGIVAYLAPQIDTGTGGRLVRLSFTPPDNLQGELPVGLSADVNIVAERRADAITVPRTAIRAAATDPHVLVAKDGVVERRAVTFKEWPSASVLIDSGLISGEQIIVSAAPPAIGTSVKTAATARGGRPGAN